MMYHSTSGKIKQIVENNIPVNNVSILITSDINYFYYKYFPNPVQFTYTIFEKYKALLVHKKIKLVK